MNLTLPGVEKRLQDRYQQLVEEHAGHGHPTASGPRLLPNEASCQAAAMAAWRFYNNPRTTFTRLAAPLLQAGCAAAAVQCQDFALVALDWSWLNYSRHDSKKDRLDGPHGLFGYKLLSALLVSDRDGQPLAPLASQLRTATGLCSSRFDRVFRARPPLDELAAVMDFVAQQPLGKPPVFIIDAEADSVYHFRWWQRRDFLYLVRVGEERYVRLRGEQDTEEVPGVERRLPTVVWRLQRQKAFRRVRQVKYEGRKVWQYVAEVNVLLDRSAWLNREIEGKRKRKQIRGKALPARLIVTELRNKKGRVVERWYLLSNAPAAVAAATIALWYYWRWKIETFFKLLKSAGQQIEHWQQEAGPLLFKRLLVASMACVLAWRLGYSEAPQAAEARRVVMGLSGRQVAHGKDYTLEGLLAGTWVLLALVALLKQKPISQIHELADFVLQGSIAPNSVANLPLAANSPPPESEGDSS